MINTDEIDSTRTKSPFRGVLAYSFFWIISLIVCLIAGIISGRIWQYSLDQEYALSSLAERLEVDNDPQIIRNKVHCHLLEMGASKSSIEKTLNNIGMYQEYDAWNGSTLIAFDDYFTRLTIDDLVLRFEDDKLVEKSIDVTDSTIPIRCP
jgi:uncharacterized protein YneF (UPF0154 family)